MAVITTTTDGTSVFPGQTSLNYAGGPFSNTQKYRVLAGATLFPGLLVGRAINVNNNYLDATSLDQIGSPTIENIIGGLSYATFGESTPPGLEAGYGNLTPYPATTLLNIYNSISGYIYLWAGATLDGTSQLSVATTTTGSGNTLVYAGSLVPATFSGTGPVISLANYAAINGLVDGITYTRGQLVPVSLSFYNR